MNSMSRGLFGRGIRRTGGPSNRTYLTSLVAALGVSLGGCSGGDSSDSSAASLDISVADVAGLPVGGAVVTVTAGRVQRQTTTGPDGSAKVLDLPTGEATLAVTAAGFESATGSSTLQRGSQPTNWSVILRATRAWAVGRAVVLGTRMIDRSANGSTMTFSVDLAVIGEYSEPLQALTSSDFSVYAIDCGWGGPRDCASDAAGNATHSFQPGGPAESFSMRPPSVRRPYLVGVLAERSTAVTDWSERAPALKSFFTMLGGNDSASLASVQTEDRGETLTALGPFTSDGRAYFDAIDQLARPAGSAPVMLDSLLESIRRTAAAGSSQIPGVERTVLVMATPWMSISDVNTATALAQQLGVRISAVVVRGNFGFPEMAMRTGGFAVDVGDSRQLGMVFGAMDQLLAGTAPCYRMQFRLVGSPGTFVSGGNAKVWMRIHVPTSTRSNGVHTSLDVAIL